MLRASGTEDKDRTRWTRRRWYHQRAGL